MIVRRAVKGDCAEIARLLKIIAMQHTEGRPDLFRPVVKYDAGGVAAMLAAGDPIFVAEENVILGYLIAKIQDNEAHAVKKPYRCLYVDDLCVDPDCRGTGVGRMLFETAKEFARENGCYNIELNVWEFNGGARAFYERMGMSEQRRTMELILTGERR